MSKKTSELLAKLKKMAAQAGEHLFERAGMAIEVLADEQWIADTYAGDKGKAEEVIAAGYFPDLSMSGWFGRLLVLRKTYPDVGHWRSHKFNLQRLWVAHEKLIEGGKPTAASVTRERVTRKEFEHVKDELDSAKYQARRKDEQLEAANYQLRRKDEEVVSWKNRCRDMERRCHELERELTEARGRIATLEILVDKRSPELAVA